MTLADSTSLNPLSQISSDKYWFLGNGLIRNHFISHYHYLRLQDGYVTRVDLRLLNNKDTTCSSWLKRYL